MVCSKKVLKWVSPHILYNVFCIMSLSYKKRKKIIEDEILDEKWNHIYLERQIKKIIQNRYPNKEIQWDSRYIYQKMAVLLAKKIYIQARWIPKRFIASSWYINVFDLHKKLTDLIKVWHLSEKDKKIYTEEERMYMKSISGKR